MQTSSLVASSPSERLTVVAMASGDQSGAGGSAGISPSPGGPAGNCVNVTLVLNKCTGIQLGNYNIMNINQFHSNQPGSQGGNGDPSSDSEDDDDDEEEEDSKMRKKEQKRQLKSLQNSADSEDDKSATEDQLRNLSQKIGKHWRLFCRSLGITDKEMDFEEPLPGGHQIAKVTYSLLCLRKSKPSGPIKVSELARAILLQGSNLSHLVELLQ